MKQHFELRRVRDFGEIISDSIVFLKDNFKPLAKPLLVICGAFLAMSVIGHLIMQMNMLDMMSPYDARNPRDVNTSTFNMFKGLGYYYAGIFPFILSIYLVTYSYMAILLEKKEGEKPSLEEVWGYFKYYFFRGAGSFIVILLIGIVGFILCVLPGIYLSVVLSLALPIIVFENASFGYSFNKSFKLISGNWWVTFGVILLMVIVVGFAGSIASIPISLITSFNTFMGLSTGIVYPLIAFLSTVLHTIMLIGYSLVAIATAFCYLSYSEQKDGTSLIDRINKFGSNDDDTANLPTEQY